MRVDSPGGKVCKCPVSTKDAFVRTVPADFVDDIQIVVKKLRRANAEPASAPVRAAITKETFLAKMKEKIPSPGTPAKKARGSGGYSRGACALSLLCRRRATWLARPSWREG